MDENNLIKQMKLVVRTTVATKAEHRNEQVYREDIEDVVQCYYGLSDFYARAESNFKFYTGDQWHEKIQDENGIWMREDEYIRSKNKIPFVNNMIAPIVNNLDGQFRGNAGRSTVHSRKRELQDGAEMLTSALRVVEDINEMSELDATTFKNGIITGLFVQKCVYKYFDEYDRGDVKVSVPNFGRLFFNSDLDDVRAKDIHIIGELHDMGIDNIVKAFAKNSVDEERIRGWYSVRERVSTEQGLRGSVRSNVIVSDDMSKGRVIELWREVVQRKVYEHDTLFGKLRVTTRSLEEVAADNAERVRLGIEAGLDEDSIALIKTNERYETTWQVRYLTPQGYCLYEGFTPYAHQSHPYIVRFARLVNGRVWGLVEDTKPQQKDINRKIAMLDFLVGAGAKGVLLVPEDAIPDDMNLDEITDQWSRFDGVIKLKMKPGVPVPQQIAVNNTNIGIKEQLALQMDIIEKSSGVSGAMQGHNANAGTPASLYQQQTLNSSVNSRGLLDSFRNFRRRRDMLIVKLIVQFYNDDRYLSIVGESSDVEAMRYDTEKVKQLEWDLVTSDGVDTPVYRFMIDEQLNRLLELGVIDADMYLQNSSYPFSDKMLAQLKAKRERENELAAEADPNMVAKVQEMMGGANAGS